MAKAMPGMMRRKPAVSRLWLGGAFHLVVTLATCLTVSCALADDEAAARGRRLFETGVGRDGQSIVAVFTDSGTPVPGKLLSCAGCHGRDATGRPVKGIDPPNISWQNLTKPYALQARAGRSRLPYDEALFLRAVVTGIDSSNQKLGTAMPRFRLTPGDGADLLAYMRELGTTTDPGITAQEITIGIALSPRTSELDADVRTALNLYGEEVNRGGGIFGRRIVFAFEDDHALSGQSGALHDKNILAAVVGGAVAPTALSDDIPLVAVRSDAISRRPNAFYVSAGLLGELGALAMQAARELGATARLTVLHTDDDAGRQLLADLRGLLLRNGGPTFDAVPLADRSDAAADETVRRVRASDAVLFAGWDQRAPGLLARLDPALVLLPGSLIDALPDAPTRMLVAYQPGAFFVQRDTLPKPVQRTVLAAARLVVEGLRRAGRDVSRARLVDSLETIQRFDVGYGAPVSYGPQQHVGFTGAQILYFDAHGGQAVQRAVNVELD
ncbi:ABC transporter substrate-binding protein [Bradyrhizobium diazoefficiens]|nr:ABC transporter substrate-binding protein [Bradyrhizobium diazoefficiens]MBR0774236.1 ABC transporter substrate-binding protein [Bradyrhizobium diazoefficiens]